MCTYTFSLVTSGAFTMVAAFVELGLLIVMHEEIKDYTTSYSQFLKYSCYLLMAVMGAWVIGGVLILLSMPFKKSVFVSIWKIITLVVIFVLLGFLIGCVMNTSYIKETGGTLSCFIITILIELSSIGVYIYASQGHDKFKEFLDSEKRPLTYNARAAATTAAPPVPIVSGHPQISGYYPPYQASYPQGQGQDQGQGQGQAGYPAYGAGYPSDQAYPQAQQYVEKPAVYTEEGAPSRYANIPEEDGPPPRTYGARMAERDDVDYNIKRSSSEDGL